MKLKTVPVIYRHDLVSFISVPSIMVRLERYLKAPKSIIKGPKQVSQIYTQGH